jgi:hypothetical protein
MRQFCSASAAQLLTQQAQGRPSTAVRRLPWQQRQVLQPQRAQAGLSWVYFNLRSQQQPPAQQRTKERARTLQTASQACKRSKQLWQQQQQLQEQRAGLASRISPTLMQSV